MGGKVVLLGGDFRQTLPVIPRAHQTAIVNNTLRWPHFRVLKLTENIRTGPEQLAFTEWLLALGQDRLEKYRFRNTETVVIQIPNQCAVSSIDELVASVYDEQLDGDFSKAGILCTTNKSADTVNTNILEKLPGGTKSYSHDTYDARPDDEFLRPFEVLNSIVSSSLPPISPPAEKGSGRHALKERRP